MAQFEKNSGKTSESTNSQQTVAAATPKVQESSTAPSTSNTTPTPQSLDSPRQFQTDPDVTPESPDGDAAQGPNNNSENNSKPDSDSESLGASDFIVFMLGVAVVVVVVGFVVRTYQSESNENSAVNFNEEENLNLSESGPEAGDQTGENTSESQRLRIQSKSSSKGASVSVEERV